MTVSTPPTVSPLQAITYEQFISALAVKWEPGQHIALIAPTGGGKTMIAQDLISLRRFAVVVATKAKDKTLDHYRYPKIAKWPPEWNQEQVILWKKPKALGDFSEQQHLIYECMNDIYRRGGYTVYFDDLYYITNTLGLKKAVQMFYTQVRSQNVSIIAALQRPSWVPLEAVNQSTYLCMFRINDTLDLERIAQAISMDKKVLISLNEQLGDYEFLVLQTRYEPFKVLRRTA